MDSVAGGTAAQRQGIKELKRVVSGALWRWDLRRDPGLLKACFCDLTLE